jgi:putative SOS response-associated peptidase YedK
MCGRYANFTPAAAIARILEARPERDLVEPPPRYNIAPSMPVLAVHASGEGARTLTSLRWGLVPFWARDPGIGNRLINARLETVHSKPAFRAAYRARRCVLPADGFYEWRAGPMGKQAFFMQPHDSRPFWLAGIWENWRSPQGERLRSCAIITTEAGGALREIHHRMPVVLPTEALDSWLSAASLDSGTVGTMLAAGPGFTWECRPVSSWVNRPTNEGPRCIEAVSVQKEAGS